MKILRNLRYEVADEDAKRMMKYTTMACPNLAQEILT